MHTCARTYDAAHTEHRNTFDRNISREKVLAFLRKHSLSSKQQPEGMARKETSKRVNTRAREREREKEKGRERERERERGRKREGGLKDERECMEIERDET